MPPEFETPAGTGERPAATASVKLHYLGSLPDGSVFDSSVQRGEPALFKLDQVIPCFSEGLQRMKVGGKAELYCPPELAYGERGAPPRIPGGSALLFEVELLAINELARGAFATPVILDGRIYLRTLGEFYCLGETL